MDAPTQIIVLSTLLIGLLIGALGNYLINRLAAMLGDHERRLQELEDLQTRRRHTESTKECIEDALAVAIDIIMEDQAQDEYRKARLRQLQQIMQLGQVSPTSYPVDRPAGPKPDKPNGHKKRQNN
jgi:hypothetical protein